MDATLLNWPAVIAGTIAAFALGMIWFSPMMFGRAWAMTVVRRRAVRTRMTVGIGGGIEDWAGLVDEPIAIGLFGVFWSPLRGGIVSMWGGGCGSFWANPCVTP